MNSRIQLVFNVAIILNISIHQRYFLKLQVKFLNDGNKKTIRDLIKFSRSKNPQQLAVTILNSQGMKNLMLFCNPSKKFTRDGLIVRTSQNNSFVVGTTSPYRKWAVKIILFLTIAQIPPPIIPPGIQIPLFQLRYQEAGLGCSDIINTQLEEPPIQVFLMHDAAMLRCRFNIHQFRHQIEGTLFGILAKNPDDRLLQRHLSKSVRHRFPKTINIPL